MNENQFSRRQIVTAAIAGVVVLSLATPTAALSEDDAVAHVNATIDDVVTLLGTKRTRSETAAALRQIFERRTALAALTRFCAGRHWSGMSDAQKADYTDAFAGYIAYVYAGYFGEYEGDVAELRSAIEIVKTVDAGGKGILVESQIRPERDGPVSLDWLVSDRSGQVAISDVVIEGISLAVTQRETTVGMFEARGGDAERLIADMRKEAGQ